MPDKWIINWTYPGDTDARSYTYTSIESILSRVTELLTKANMISITKLSLNNTECISTCIAKVEKRPERARKEIGKQCGLCKKKKESHMYPFPFKGKYLRLCSICWNDVETNKKHYMHSSIIH